MDELTAALTDAQRTAVLHTDGPLLILAGPGSGKTRVVTHRIAHLLRQGVRDHQIVALTFTNKAADEMQSRLGQLAPHAHVFTGTFHKFCARLLRRHAPLVGLQENLSIYDMDDARVVLREAVHDAGIESSLTTLPQLIAAISRFKSELALAEDFPATRLDAIEALAARVYPHYQKRLLAANAVDFDDLLLHVAVLLREHDELRQSLDERFRYVLVDEFQDTNVAQYQIVRALSVAHPNLAATGDPDQSIYGWRGASTRNFSHLERDYPDLRVVWLEQNFRSTKRILRVADQLITNNVHRKPKQLITDNAEGALVRLVCYDTGQAEAQAIAMRIANEIAAARRRPRDFAVFYRTNALSRSVEQALRAVGVPYQIVRGLEFYNRKEIKDVLAYLRLLNNPADDVALLRIINTPPRRIGKTTVRHLTAHGGRYGIPLLQAARESGLIESLGKRTAVQVARFVALIDELRAAVGESVEDILRRVLQATDYAEWLAASDLDEETRRVENIDELLSDAREFDENHLEDGGLEPFLEQASLVADTDDWAEDLDRVTLMTLHAAKGLEFPVVFIVAVEDRILPHERSREDPAQLEEERRLLFVGMTRAEQELHLSFTHRRRARGDLQIAAPSQFLLELPRDEMDVTGLDTSSTPVFRDPDLEWDGGDGDGGDGESDEWDQGAAADLGADAVDLDTGAESRPPRRRSTAKRRNKPESPAHLVTAAQMLSPSAARSIPPDTLQPGMLVSHPEYGVGCVVELEGTGRRQMARVKFFQQVDSVTLSVIHSPLQLFR